jgi:hypothetical protein
MEYPFLIKNAGDAEERPMAIEVKIFSDYI